MTVGGSVEAADAARVLDRGLRGLRAQQAGDGSWPTPLETDASVTALHVLSRHYLARIDRQLEAEMVRYIRHEQDRSGGWSGYPGGPPLLDSTVLCYAALKAAGASATDPALAGAAGLVQELGGVGRASLLVRAFLALLGQAPLEGVPKVPTWLVRVPGWLHPNLRDLGIFALVVVPISALIGRKAVRRLPPGRGVEELVDPTTVWRLLDAGRPTGAGEFGLATPSTVGFRASGLILAVAAASAAARLLRRLAPHTTSDDAAWRWIAGRQGRDGTFGEALWPTILNLMALDTEPSGRYRPEMDRGFDALDRWPVQDARGTWQPFTSGTTCMTALALVTLTEAGADVYDSSVERSIRWLVDHRASIDRGDSRPGVEGPEPAGWYFGESNDRFPDADDTTIVLQALLPFRNRCEEELRSGVQWLLAAEHHSGGWAAYSNDGGRAATAALGLLAPEMADLPDADITARVLFLLAELRGGELDADGRISRAVDRGVEFLWSRMRPDGTWGGRWMVNHVYGTAQVLEALARCSRVPGDVRADRSISWLESVQNGDGGWGESKQGYHSGAYEPGPSNPLITSAAVLAMVALGRRRSRTVTDGIRYLMAAQEADGLWYDRDRSGVVFPNASYTSYHLAATCGAIVSIHRALQIEPSNRATDNE